MYPAFLLVALLTASPAPPQQEQIADPPDPGWRRPLSSRNQMPLSLLFVYMTPDRASSLSRGRSEIDIELDYSNIVTRQETDGALLVLDLEYLRTNFTYKRGFGSGLELSFSLPFYVYHGGFLDPLVNGFHETFGLPNFQRGRTPFGLVQFEYVHDRGVVFRGQEAFGALGDASLHAKKTLIDDYPFGLALRGSVKLPTGNPETLSGSGETDAGIGIAFDRIGARFGVYANASYHFLGSSELVPTRDFLSLMGGFDYLVKPRLAMLVQVDYLRPFLAGELPILNESSRQLALGLRWRHSERFVYEWRFVEDLGDLAPDFTLAFQMAIGWMK